MSKNLIAVLCVVLAVLCFNLNDSLMKSLFQTEPVYVIVGTRALMVMSILTTALILLIRQNPFKGFRDRGTLIFGFGECMVAMPYLTSLLFLSLGVSAALIFTAPIMTTALGAIFLKEKVGLFRWSAVLLGFVGVIFVALGEPITRALFPELGTAWFGALVEGQSAGPSTGLRIVLLGPIIAALALSTRDLLSRAVPSKLPTVFNAAYSALFVLLSSVICFFIFTPLFPDVFEPTLRGRTYFDVIGDFSLSTWLKLFGSSLLISTAYYFSALSLRLGEISVISPFRYVGLPGAMILDVALFQAVPQWNEYTGGVLIVLAGLIIIWRESQKGKITQPHPASRRS